MEGQYKTSDGMPVKVVMFDELNKMVYVELPTGQNKWFTESEYSSWVKEGGEEVVYEEALPLPVENPAEIPKVKRTYKKKDK